jgi:predicted nucleotidyltransferase
MSGSRAVHVDAEELALVRQILAAHLPEEVRTSVFGSRAGGVPKRFSDLDLVLEGPEPLSLSLLARLAEAFDESSLPWKVDLIDRRSVDAGFGQIIDAAKIPLA